MTLLELVQQATASYTPVELIAKPLAAALGLSLVVERVIELLKNVSDLLPTTAAGRAVEPVAAVGQSVDSLAQFHANAAAQEQDERFAEKRLQLAELQGKLATATPDEKTRLEAEIATLQEMIPATPGAATEVDERFPHETMLVLPATDPDSGGTLRAFVIQALALAVGIVAARIAGVHLFAALYQGATGTVAQLPGGVATDFVLTGLLIGGGSAPVHMLIRFIGERTLAEAPKVAAAPAPAPAPARPAAAAVEIRANAGTASDDDGDDGDAGSGGGAGDGSTTAVSATPAVVVRTALDWVDIPYDGGVDVAKLEAIHRRPGNPNLIVYHHTAMPLKSTFGDVVRVIHDRKDSSGRPWITGYHCVVTADGVAHPFCRWDRYGNHAQGFNARSLGISLNGNFETDPSVPDTNATGRYGPATPPPAQLEMAARVVALWCHLYRIPLDFEKAIIPHKKVSPKTCPGSNFPYEDFKRLVTYFHGAWQGAAGQERVHAFAQKPYLFV